MPTAPEDAITNGRTFAIISHPDAGKTTLTEKLLLYGGAIREAGAVKARRAQQHARSDWMEIERQRGISVTSTVLQFRYQGYRINLLDTPGHQDFSEDTYRTLLAADSVVMVLDAAKGVEEQTIKLYQVARRRQVPVFTFVNKLDRESRDPWDILEEIERILGISTFAMNWPVGMGMGFQGLFDRASREFEAFNRQNRTFDRMSLNDAPLDSHDRMQLQEDLELLEGAGEAFSQAAVTEGVLTPVYFGSAIANFGVETFLNGFLTMAPPPRPRESSAGWVAPEAPYFSGFVFKIQANMNPAHRDRVAFVRVCSGKFERNMPVAHVQSGRTIRLAQPQQFMAQDRAIIDEAFPGDVIGIHDTGLLHIGDTLSEKPDLRFVGFPRFSPEHFAEVELKYTLKHKQYQRGLDELVQEGLVQRYRPEDLGPQVFLGVVGPLQFEVLEYRLKQEYGVEVTLRPLGYRMARWVVEGPAEFELGRFDRVRTVIDDEGQRVLLLEDERSLERLLERHPSLRVAESSPLREHEQF
ncbi:peptide chain release factor 3 [Sulfobacillus harzensis]|uniref:Peptide chain release factor 3 n=1 Tax=Sulfobacillus harzensis TaxID=2729629 RepID=A0A7Y0L5M1_9FIRM|nr:peptide chain release factor 3 [Sulfobacillus harzensis]NMP22329.1 peptide chain release factor 3 [Sulfobacillus harzensis]